jgi:hypothetical protein
MVLSEAMIRSTIGLKVIDANFAAFVKVPTWLAKYWLVWQLAH